MTVSPFSTHSFFVILYRLTCPAWLNTPSNNLRWIESHSAGRTETLFLPTTLQFLPKQYPLLWFRFPFRCVQNAAHSNYEYAFEPRQLWFYPRYALWRCLTNSQMYSARQLPANRWLFAMLRFFGFIGFVLLYIFFKFKLPIFIRHICTSFRYYNSSALKVVYPHNSNCGRYLSYRLHGYWFHRSKRFWGYVWFQYL